MSAHVFEDGQELGPGNSQHGEIRRVGEGRFSVWGTQLYFSSGDNSSPLDNGRSYQLLFANATTYEERPTIDRIKRARELSRSVVLKLDPARFFPDAGNCFTCTLPEELPKSDSPALSFGSAARLFENGIELGPRVSHHDEIRARGGGRFWHSGSHLYFSTLDNSSPVTNRRNYELLLPSSLIGSGTSSPWLDGFEIEHLSSMERLEFARALYRSVWPGAVLPDMARRVEHDRQFARDFHRVSPDADYTAERKFNLDQLFKLVRRLPGDVAECGVYKGASAFFLARHLVEEKLDKLLWLFDSFEGLSSPGDQDDQSYWYSGALASSPADIRQALAPLGEVPFVRVCRGWIPERFQEAEDRLFCFVHIDVDLYQPTLDSISFFYPRMVPGGIILLDDYGFDNCKGVTEAVDCFMADKPEPIVNVASGGAFILKEDASRADARS
jgi:hypothetical protein